MYIGVAGFLYFFFEKMCLCHFQDYCCVVLFPQVISRAYNFTLSIATETEQKSTVGVRALTSKGGKEVRQGQ